MDYRNLLTALTLLLALAGAARALPPGVVKTASYRDAPGLALTDVATLPSKLRPTSFYLYDPVSTPQSIGVYSFTLNAVVSKSPTIIKPRVVKGGGVTVLWWDLEEVCPDPDDLARVWLVLQSLAYFDPYYHEPAIAPQVKSVTKWVLEPSDWWQHRGQWYQQRWVEKQIETVEKRPIQFAVGAGGAGALQALSEFCGGSLLPIVHGPWFLTAAWSTTDHSGIPGSKHGYYQLAGIGEKEAEFFKLVGADAQTVARIGSDRRAALISGITRKWRIVEAAPTLGIGPDFGAMPITITLDIADADVADKDAVAYENLLNPKVVAKEIIAGRSNGLQLFWMGNGKGERQNEVPTNVVDEPVIRVIDCLRCHGPHRGYQPVRNEVLEDFQAGTGPVDDLSSKAGSSKTYNRLQRFKWNAGPALKSAGLTYAGAVDQAVGGVYGPKSVETVSSLTVQTYEGYKGHLSPHALLKEIGYEVPVTVKGLEFKAVVDELIPIRKDIEEHPQINRLRNCREQFARGDVHRILPELALREAQRKR